MPNALKTYRKNRDGEILKRGCLLWGIELRIVSGRYEASLGCSAKACFGRQTKP